VDLRADVITLGVEDVDRAKRFYHEGFGLAIEMDAGHFVRMALGEGEGGKGVASLALYPRAALSDDAGVDPAGSGFKAVVVSMIVDSSTEVDAVLTAAETAGGEIVKAGETAQWGGYSGHFADPDGNLWKVASQG
jgi:predicted enzyme related to lactoylglutathione lyase